MATPSQGTKNAQGVREPRADEKKQSARCECGNLLAMIVKEGVEIKCRRCKRLVLIPAQIDEDYLKMLQNEEARKRH